MKHEPKSTNFKWTLTLSEPVRSIEVRRIPCSCGWEGDWCESVDTAVWSFNRHLEGPRRDCGHPFTHVGYCTLCPADPVEAL